MVNANGPLQFQWSSTQWPVWVRVHKDIKYVKYSFWWYKGTRYNVTHHTKLYVLICSGKLRCAQTMGDHTNSLVHTRRGTRCETTCPQPLQPVPSPRRVTSKKHSYVCACVWLSVPSSDYRCDRCAMCFNARSLHSRLTHVWPQYMSVCARLDELLCCCIHPRRGWRHRQTAPSQSSVIGLLN